MFTKKTSLIIIPFVLFLSGSVLGYADDEKSVTVPKKSDSSSKSMTAPPENKQTGTSKTNTKDMADVEKKEPKKRKTYSDRYRERYSSDTYAKDYKERFEPENYRKEFQRDRRDYRSGGLRGMPGEISPVGQPDLDDLTEEQKELLDLTQLNQIEQIENQPDGFDDPQLVNESQPQQETFPEPKVNKEQLYRLLQPPTNLSKLRNQMQQNSQLPQDLSSNKQTKSNQDIDQEEPLAEQTIEETLSIELDEENAPLNQSRQKTTHIQQQPVELTQLRNIQLNKDTNSSLSPKAVLFEEGFNALKFRRYSEAQRNFEQLHTLSPDDQEYQYALGLTSLLQGDHKKATEWFFQTPQEQEGYPDWFIQAMRSRNVNFQVNRLQHQQNQASKDFESDKLLEFIDEVRTY